MWRRWGANASSWLRLVELNLDRNILHGTLPPQWGAGGSFSSVRGISLANNMLTGSIPAAWNFNAFPQSLAIALQPQQGAKPTLLLPAPPVDPQKCAACGEQGTRPWPIPGRLCSNCAGSNSLIWHSLAVIQVSCPILSGACLSPCPMVHTEHCEARRINS